jgi:predicted permease
MEHFLVSVNVVLPVFIIIALGYFLRYKKVIDESFIKMTMKVIFNISLPVLLFSKVSKVDMGIIFNIDSLKFVLFVFIGTLIVFFLAIIIANYKKIDQKSKATFIQGVYRSNYVIIGYSIIYSLFGDQMIGRMAILVLVIVPLYNILAIFLFSKSDNNGAMSSFKAVLIKIIKNPLIIGIVLGFIVAIIKVEMPVVLDETIDKLGSIGMPLGLLGIGAYFTSNKLDDFKESVLAVGLKVFIFPIIMTIIAYILGFGYMDVSIIFVLFGSPTAITSFIMATAFEGDSKLAANIVILSTAVSLFTLVFGLSIISFLLG